MLHRYSRHLILCTCLLLIASFARTQTVYICTGNYAYAYHSRSNCPGLNNCKGEIRYTDRYTAEYSFSRRPCCRCWRNVANNCNDDNPSYVGGGGGGGGAGAGYALIAIGIVVAVSSAVILSNEVAVSFSFATDYSRLYINPGTGKVRYGPGVTVLFRKNFKFSPVSKASIEYGFSYHSLTTNYLNNNIPYNYITPQWTFHFDYLHQIFRNKIGIDKLYLMAGPSIAISDYGFAGGGIFSLAYKPHSRIKLEFRTEVTNAFFQFRVGIQVLYQKYYFWQKKKGKYIDYEQ